MTADVKVTITAIISNSDPIAIFFFSSSYHLKKKKTQNSDIYNCDEISYVSCYSIFVHEKKKKEKRYVNPTYKHTLSVHTWMHTHTHMHIGTKAYLTSVRQA